MLLGRQVAIFLSNNGIGRFQETGTGGNIFLNRLPANPDEAIAVFATGGPMIDPMNEYAGRAIQILIRTSANDPRPGEQTAQAVIDLLKGFNGDLMVPGGNYVIDVEALQDGPNNIGQDENRRYEYSQNFIFQIVKRTRVNPLPDPTGSGPAPIIPTEPDIEDPGDPYVPVNLSLERQENGKYMLRWELKENADLALFSIFAGDMLVAEAGAGEREKVLDIMPGTAVFMCSIDQQGGEHYSDAVVAE